MTTAIQLIPALVDAAPIFWDRSYIKDMRPIRGYPNYWRITDRISYIDGPMAQGGNYSTELFPWQAEILLDENLELTDTIELRNLRNALDVSSEIVDGETIYSYQYNTIAPDFSYTHTDVIDSVSLEFDQSGRRLVAFESAGDVNFIWFDPVAGMQVVTNFGAGYNPQIVTDNYFRTGGSADSERLLFYVKDSTKQIVYRRQDDRYQTEYTLPSAPADVVELIKVSKNIYGGLTVLYCYESEGELVTGSFTARSEVDSVTVGTDGENRDPMSITGDSGEIVNFVLKVGAIILTPEESVSITGNSATLTNFELRSTENFLTEQTSATSPVSSGSATLTNFELVSVVIEPEPQVSTVSIVDGTSSATLTNFNLVVSVIEIMPEEFVTITPTTATLTNFSLGV